MKEDSAFLPFALRGDLRGKENLMVPHILTRTRLTKQKPPISSGRDGEPGKEEDRTSGPAREKVGRRFGRWG